MRNIVKFTCCDDDGSSYALWLDTDRIASFGEKDVGDGVLRAYLVMDTLWPGTRLLITRHTVDEVLCLLNVPMAP